MTVDPTPPDDNLRKTQLVSVAGRQIVIRQATDAQGPLLIRELNLLRNERTDTNRKIIAMARIYDILESLIVQDEDREFLMDLNVKGELGLATMMGFLSAFVDDEEAPKTGPVVRRGRPPKRG